MARRRYTRGEVPGARLYWLDTGWGCGGVFVLKGRIVGGASIFSRLAGQKLKDLPGRYKSKKVKKKR
jgi:hypothetical protein